MSSSQRIFEQLRDEILAGRVAPGERLPPERSLAEVYSTNRNTLREALRKLEQLGLVRARQGQGITVLDFRADGTLELLTPFLIAGSDTGERASVLVDLLQARRQVLQSTLVLVAERHTASDMARLEALAEAQIVAYGQGEIAEVVRGDIALVDAFFDASHSLTFRWIANSLLGVAREIVERFPALWVQDKSYPEVISRLITALKARKGDEAAEILHTYYLKTDSVLVGLLGSITATQSAAVAPKETP